MSLRKIVNSARVYDTYSLLLRKIVSSTRVYDTYSLLLLAILYIVVFTSVLVAIRVVTTLIYITYIQLVYLLG